jgi:oligopeptide/dipeptide ABC transporter ATP-binding protein
MKSAERKGVDDRDGREAPLLEIHDLVALFDSGGRRGAAVNGVSITLRQGEALGIVGESGSGKTTLALSVLRLLPDPPGRIAGGRILFRGRDLLRFSTAEMRRIRGREISMIFQEPRTALNPVFTVGQQIAEALQVHERRGRREIFEEVLRIMAAVGIPAPEKTARAYPHQLSGGLLQRSVIAMALICGPELLIADEPTSALDVTVQAQILDLLGRLRADEGRSILLISHDFGVVAEICDRVAVMYAARIVEEAPVEQLFRRPRHPYTAALFRSMPGLDRAGGSLESIPGTVPSLFAYPPGCPYHPRCPFAEKVCGEEIPPLEESAPGMKVACFFPLKAESDR